MKDRNDEKTVAAERFPRNYPAPDMGASFRVGRYTYGRPLQPGFSRGAIDRDDPKMLQDLLSDADTVGERADRAMDVLAGVYAPRNEETEQAMDRHTDVWIGWAQARGIVPNHAPPSAVAEHIALLRGTLEVSSIRRRRRAISELHQRAGHADPTADTLVTRAFEVATRGGKTRELKIVPILAADYQRIIAAIPMRTLADLRDRVAIGIGWEALATSNEAAVLPVGSLRFTQEGIIVTIRSKWSRTLLIARRENHDLVAATHDWIDRTQIVDGPLLRSVRDGTIGSEEIVGHTLRKMIKSRAAAVGINADTITWRSLRNGYLASGLLHDMDEFTLAQRAGFVGNRPLLNITNNVLPRIRNH